MHEERKNDSLMSIEFLEEQIREVDDKIAEIELAVNRLSAEEANLISQRAEKVTGGIEDIVHRSRENQRRLQEIRDFIEIEQAPLAELKAKREEFFRHVGTLRRLKAKEKLKSVLLKVDALQASLAALKQEIDAMDALV